MRSEAEREFRSKTSALFEAAEGGTIISPDEGYEKSSSSVINVKCDRCELEVSELEIDSHMNSHSTKIREYVYSFYI